MSVDFSVPEADLRGWLANPDFTPCPAIAQALLGTPAQGAGFPGRHRLELRAHARRDIPAGRRRRTPDVLKAAVLEGSNERYGTQATAVEQLFTP
ncbi:hypothetical protein [Streptomyces sp. ISID311]|uniref:hypothetical protein n=1 Tax=Streptomyces sp. ISID311 TaxID=2601673 RepID=UPI0021C260EC|nr:hypothetical protein [Streptomyces sp. ISID311]